MQQYIGNFMSLVLLSIYHLWYGVCVIIAFTTGLDIIQSHLLVVLYILNWICNLY